MKKGVIFFLVFLLYAQNNFYSYVVYKTKFVELRKLLGAFINNNELKYKYFKPLITQTLKSPVKFLGNLEGYSDKIIADHSYKYDASIDLGIEVDINELLKSTNHKNLYHNYKNDYYISEKLSQIYENNTKAVNYKKNRFIKSISDMFEFYIQYNPKYKFLFEKYSKLHFSPSSNQQILSYKLSYLPQEKLLKYLAEKKRAFIFKITNIKSPSLLKKIKMKLKLSYTNDFGTSSRDYTKMGINISVPLTEETDNIAILKTQLIYSYNLLLSKISNFNFKRNQAYNQFNNTVNSIRLKLQDIKLDLLKIQNGIFVDYDTLTSKFITVFYQIDSLNNSLYQNLNYSAQLYSYLKDLDEY